MLTEQDLLLATETCLAGVDLPMAWGRKQVGKVRDCFTAGGQRVLIATDRLSAFDRVLGLIPYKGQVLNQLSAWWFWETEALAPNHVLAVPDPNVTLAHEAQPLPLEVVVRGYITGVTETSLWFQYARGERCPYGVKLPDGLRKNDPLPQPVITPTTKATQGHDRSITPAEIVASGLVTGEVWEAITQMALALFAHGQAAAARAGLILVDTKYEFGWVEGQLTLIDELHTPDSSRFWLAESYDDRRAPVNMSKELVREWLVAQGYRGEGVPPPLPATLRAQVAARYIDVFERLTGAPFTPAPQPAATRIHNNLAFCA